MDFDLTEEQRLLRDSVERLLADHYGFDRRRSYLAEPNGWSRALWSQYAELGLLGLPFAESYGGFGGGPIEVMLVMEALGRVLALEPYLATVVLTGTALRLAGSEAQKSRILPQIAEGQMILAFAHGERQARYDLTDVLTTAKPKGSGWLLDGAKSVVLHGADAGRLVVSARTSGERDDPEGITLFLVDAAANGVARVTFTKPSTSVSLRASPAGGCTSRIDSCVTPRSSPAATLSLSLSRASSRSVGFGHTVTPRTSRSRSPSAKGVGGRDLRSAR